MFIGHFGVALAAKKIAPRTSLGTLILSAQFLDLLWPIFLLSGLEHVRIAPGITKMSPLEFTDYPYSHSLMMTLLWSVVVGGVYYGVRRYPFGRVGGGSGCAQPLVAGFPGAPTRPAAASRRRHGVWPRSLELPGGYHRGGDPDLWRRALVVSSCHHRGTTLDGTDSGL